MKKNSVHTSSILHGALAGFTLGDFLEKESEKRSSRREADQTFLFSKILEVHGRRRHPPKWGDCRR
jgi:hypothetical protein